MSIHPSLRRTPKDKQQRSVLKRIERVQKLISEEKWQEDKIFNLPKIKTIRMKIKKEKAAEAAAAVGTEATATTVTPGAKPQGQTPAALDKTKESSKSKPETKQAK
ncbi:MAG: small basic protein [Candidatus Omnitrophota bacterium]